MGLSLLKSGRSRSSCGLQLDPLFGGHDQMAWDRPWDTEKLCSHAPRVALENLALRQQLAMWKARQPRPQLAATDRIFWVMLSVRTTCRSCAQVARARRVQVIGGGWGARCRASFFHRCEDGSALGLQQHHDDLAGSVLLALRPTT